MRRLLLTTATFGVAFVMRPIGGIVLGLYADRAGRKAALSLVIALMTLGILLLAIAPPYSAIGIGAPLMIVFARLLQGFSAGGEFGSSTALLIEAAPFSKRGFYGSWQMASQAAALLLGAMVGAVISRGLSPEALDSWGWRVPFILGLDDRADRLLYPPATRGFGSVSARAKNRAPRDARRSVPNSQPRSAVRTRLGDRAHGDDLRADQLSADLRGQATRSCRSRNRLRGDRRQSAVDGAFAGRGRMVGSDRAQGAVAVVAR